VEVCSYEARLAWSLRVDGVGDALFDEAEQFDFDVMVGELKRELMSALGVTRLRKDLVDGLLDGLRGRLISAQIDPCTGIFIKPFVG
jgi:hypothetical protein